MSVVAVDPITSVDMAAGATGATKVYGRGDNAVRALDGVTIGFPRGQLTAIERRSGFVIEPSIGHRRVSITVSKTFR